MAAATLLSDSRRFRSAATFALASLLFGFGFSTAAAQEDVDTTSIVVMDADGANLRTLYTRPGYWAGTPSISPDGKRLLFDCSPKGAFGETHMYVTTIPASPAESSASQPSAATDPAAPKTAEAADLGLGYAPAWSPDGTQIAYYIRAENVEKLTPGVWKMKADGTERTWLCAGKRPRWSPDGNQLLVVIDGPGDALRIFDLKSGESKSILDREYARIAGAAWSPDGKRLAIIGLTGMGNALLVVPANSEDRAVTFRYKGDIGWRPNWSPDGKQIVFWIRDAAGVRKLHRLDVDTDHQPELLAHQDESKFNSDPIWSPDGKQILWIRSE